MTSTPAAAGSGDPGRDRLLRVLGDWRESLLDLSGRNKLLNFRHTRTATLEIQSPDASTLLAGLARGWDFVSPAESSDGDRVVLSKDLGRPAGLVTQKTTEASLVSAVNRLRNQSGQMYNDFGLWVLWLGVGILDWRESDDQEKPSSAPLLLVPVELRRDQSGRSRLHAAEDQDAVHNPALAVKLARMGVDWTAVGKADVSDLSAVLAAARRIAIGRQGWTVNERVVLSLFASHKEAMYHDLQQNEERILAHPLVRAVALGPDAGLPGDLVGFDPPSLDRIDDVQPPERTPLVLDADASQRQCIAAALDGRSFVVSGPPGTGKSQTITNLIAALIHAGRTVLFVSEKAAALDVVRNRLRDVGLADFVLALHSGDTSKKAVATELGRVLRTEVRANGAAAHELDKARELREALSAYAAAMNERREPLGRTLHDVLGRLVMLERGDAGQPGMRLDGARISRELSASMLQQMLGAAESISRAWRPAVEGEDFLWRHLIGASPLDVLAQADDALEQVEAACRRRPLAESASEPSTARELTALIQTLRVGLPTAAAPAHTSLPDDPSTMLAELADAFGMPKPTTAAAAFSMLELADLAGADHRPLAAWLDAGTLARAEAATAELAEAVTTERLAAERAADVFGDQVLKADDLDALVQRFAEQHHGLLVRFSGQYKADRAAVAALTKTGAWHKDLPRRLGDALAWQQATAKAAALLSDHGSLLGRYTPRDALGFDRLQQALATTRRVVALSAAAERPDQVVARVADGADADPQIPLLARAVRGALAGWCDIADRRLRRWTEQVGALIGLFADSRAVQLSLQLSGTFGQARALVDRLLQDPQGAEEWRAFSAGLEQLRPLRIDELVPRSVERGVAAADFPAVVESALLRAWANAVLDADPRLRVSRSTDLDARTEDFREADRRLVAAARGAVIGAVNSRRPRNFAGGAAAVIAKQAELKSRHMPVRDLLSRTGEVVRLVKPCFMMSPLTVSQFVPADYQFDVVIFDEASQVRPSDAANCIYRGAALIVAGDEKQLPPTSFFDSAVGDDSDEWDEDLPDSFESLLHACRAGAMRTLDLRWHYRSRHEDLITFSNRSFYGNSMVTFPGAHESGNHVGVEFFRANGVYDRGGRADNVVEAELVAQRVLHHFDTRPGQSLGVVALSQAQASAIELTVEQARQARPDLDRYFTEDRLDGFFVKNLESVQGDERDVMIMSVGYGPDQYGRRSLNFGPINRPGGWRRLNVAVTRARYRMELVASFTGDELGDSDNESVQHLKRYLQYAQHGPAVLTQQVVQDQAEPESPFEESVLEVLEDWGYQVQPQVGVAGYRIDLGLRHPDALGSYALGIECDGAMYHSSKVARDRDRLREEVLAGLGWKLYRIWGTDWYRDRVGAQSRLRAAVEAAVAKSPGAMTPTPAPAPAAAPGVGRQPDQNVDGPHGEPERVAVDADHARTWAVPYRTAQVQAFPRYDMHTVEARPELRRLLSAVLKTEGPIHEDLLILRAREAWGVARSGSRIRDNIQAVLAGLVRAGSARKIESGVYGPAGDAPLLARTPDAYGPRKVLHVPSAERRLALYELASECPGMSREELVRATCDFFGWGRLGADIRSALEADIAQMFKDARLTSTGDRITAVPLT
ncbi:DUF3320 domain-containing protein [Kitasatospora sp. DSM 101779]|uniref:DUF3320 domain-containing protein n=1 Tax=Kitasatospora sp. DSM 101779 TaxID=2853165 RepID=UPI0021D8D066|nr:DUF3320 domain-containing protein [Kitasatospora sp. DSM 101779]